MDKLDVSRASLEDLKNHWLACKLDEAASLEALESGYADGVVRWRRGLLDSVHDIRREVEKVEKELNRRRERSL